MRTSPRRTFGPGTRPLGTWVKLAGPESVEIMAFAGFDFVVLDLEHAPLDLSAAYASIALADALGLAPFVRVPDHGASTIQKVLDMGAHGLVVPRVQDGDQAAAVARAASFPPDGTRGAGSTSRAGRWGTRSTSEYVAEGRDDVLLVVQVESGSAVAVAADIASVGRVDGILLGSADLALDLGVPAGDPAVLAAVDEVRAVTHAAGKLFGLAHGAAAGAVGEGFAAGDDFALASNDTTLLATAARDTVAAVRAATA